MSIFNDYMPVLATPRLRLRKLVMSDAQDIYDYGRDARVAQYVLWDAYKSIGEAKSFLRFMLRKYRCEEPASWGIELRETGRIIGTIGFMWIQDEHASAEVGYSLSREYWNKGLMTEALTAVLAYGFTHLRLNRIEAQYEVENPASGAVMMKCGMKKEGILRQRLFNKGKYRDVIVCSVLKEEYRKLNKVSQTVD